MNFMSPVPAIDAIWFYPVPTKPLQVEKAVRIDRTTIVLGKNGKLYHSRHSKCSYMLGDGDLPRATMNALAALGVITKAQAEQHMQAAKKRTEDRDKRYAADSFAEAAAKLGVTLTKQQRQAIRTYGTKRPKPTPKKEPKE